MNNRIWVCLSQLNLSSNEEASSIIVDFYHFVQITNRKKRKMNSHFMWGLNLDLLSDWWSHFVLAWAWGESKMEDEVSLSVGILQTSSNDILSQMKLGLLVNGQIPVDDKCVVGQPTFWQRFPKILIKLLAIVCLKENEMFREFHLNRNWFVRTKKEQKTDGWIEVKFTWERSNFHLFERREVYDFRPSHMHQPTFKKTSFLLLPVCLIK